MGESTDIDALIKEMNGTELSNEENSMVNSILNDLNGAEGGEKAPPPQVTSQQQMPQITEEEKAMLIQQQMQQQRIAQQRMQQQMEQQRLQQEQQQQQQQQQQQKQQLEQEKPLSALDTIKNKLSENRDVFIVMILSIFFNLDIVSENMKLKNVSFFYNQEQGKETIFAILLKGVIISVLYLVSKLLIK